jgi:hypothetical protein
MPGWLTSTMPGYAGLSGIEQIEVDTALPGGAAPQSAKLGINQIAPLNLPRNLIDGGDFTVNPFQRGTSFTGITSTLTYTADRWFAKGGASSSISVSQQAISAGSLPGFSQALQFGRAAANADTTVLKLGQVIESGDSIRCAGQNLCLSFWAEAGANFSPVGGTLTATVFGGTGTNDTAANMLAGSWANQATLFSGTVSVVNTAWGPRYVLNNNGAGIAVPNSITQLGVVFSFIPVGTAGSNDWVQFAGVQLEAGAFPSQFEHLDVQFTLEVCQRYCFVVNEPANNVLVSIGGASAAANNQNFILPAPVQMIKAPTVTVVAGSWKVAAAAAAAAATGFAAGTTHTPNYITVVSTLTQTVGLVAHLQGGGGAGSVTASADF